MPQNYSRLLRLVPVLASTLLLCAWTTPPRLVGYAGLEADPAHMEATRLDAVIFAFARIEDGRAVMDAGPAAAFDRLHVLRKRNPNLKLLISIGGWGAHGFSDAALTPASRKRFADSAVAMLEHEHADGLDVDWEYPGHGESGIVVRDSDRTHFTQLLVALRQALDRAAHGKRHDLLTAALADSQFVDHVQLKAVARQLDWVNLMTYDFNNSLTPTTGHHAGLYRSVLAAPGERNADKAMRQYLAAGVPARKIVLGVAFYARAFTDVRDRDHGLYQPYGKYLDSYNWPRMKSDYINRNGFRRYWDAKAKAPYLWNRQTRTFISYDDPESLRAKVAYVKAHGLGGIMYWEQSQDPHNELFDVLANGLKGTPGR